MSTSAGGESTGWGALVEISSEEERQAQMAKQYMAVAQMDEEERREALKKMAAAEYQLPDDKLRIFTDSRLKVWLTLESNQAKTIAQSYDYVMRNGPGPWAMKRVSMVQTVTREWNVDQLEKLRDLIPSLIKEVPRPVVTSDTYTAGSQRDRSSAKPPVWQFWKRK